jgi:hypothetical protein
MDEMGYVKKKCFTTEAGGSLMLRLLLVFLSTMLVGAMLCNPVSAQNPCDEMGPDCRVLTAAEVKAFKELVLAVKVLLPVPDAARYVHDGAAEGSYMPFIALTRFPNLAITGGSWQAGCFPIDPYNCLYFGYDAKATIVTPDKQSKDPIAIVQAATAIMENKIEISVELMPHPYLVYIENGKALEVPDIEAYNIENSAEFLSWQTGDDFVTLTMIFGPRTIKEEETLNTNKPAPNFAPLKSIKLFISGPKVEVATLKKRIDRHAFAALLGPVVK